MVDRLEVLEENLSAISKRSFTLPPTRSSLSRVEMIKASNGSLTMSLQGKLLHSRVNPEAEGKKFADGLKLKEGDHLLLYGFGLAYHIGPILDIIGPSGKIIVIELNDDIVLNALASKDFSSLLLRSNFFLITGGTSELLVSKSLSEVCSANWSGVSEERTRVAVYAPTYQFFPVGFESIKRAFDVQKMGKRFDVILGDKARRNLKNNSPYVLNSKSVTEKYGKYKGYLGVLVGSGPSLDSAIRFLKYLPKKSFLLAVDSSLRSLLANGIRVDALLSVDPQDEVYRHVGNMPKTSIPLFFVADSNHALLRSYGGEKFSVPRAGTEKGSDDGSLESGGAVSCIGLELLIRFALNPIVQIGLDSSFPGTRYYANHVSDEIFGEITRLETLNDAHMKKISNDDRVTVKNFAGGDTISHLNLFSYLRTIEHLAGSSHHVSIRVPGTSGAFMKQILPQNLAEIFYKQS